MLSPGSNAELIASYALNHQTQTLERSFNSPQPAQSSPSSSKCFGNLLRPNLLRQLETPCKRSAGTLPSLCA